MQWPNNVTIIYKSINIGYIKFLVEKDWDMVFSYKKLIRNNNNYYYLLLLLHYD
jgi:hypothetical protein